MVHTTNDKVLKHDDKGNFDELKINAEDPAIIDNDEFIRKADGTYSDTPNPRFGLHKFLDWTLKHDENNEEYWEATGMDFKKYKIVSDEPPKPKKKGKVVIE